MSMRTSRRRTRSACRAFRPSFSSATAWRRDGSSARCRGRSWRRPFASISADGDHPLVPGAGVTAPGVTAPGVTAPGTWLLVPGTWYLVPDTRYPTPDIRLATRPATPPPACYRPFFRQCHYGQAPDRGVGHLAGPEVRTGAARASARHERAPAGDVRIGACRDCLCLDRRSLPLLQRA